MFSLLVLLYCSVKKTIIGKHCTVGNNVKLVNCIVHNHVTIKDNCTITGCVLCNNAYIGEDCGITNCQVGVKYNLEEGSQHKNEHLVLGE